MAFENLLVGVGQVGWLVDHVNYYWIYGVVVSINNRCNKPWD